MPEAAPSVDGHRGPVQTRVSPGDAAARLAEKWGAGFVDETEEQGAETPSGEVIDDETPAIGPEAEQGEQADEDESEEREDGEREDEGDGETASFSTLTELLEAGGADPDSLTVSLKINGREEEMTLAEALSGTQREADYRRKTGELADQRRAFEAERAAEAERLAEAVKQAGAIRGVLSNIFDQEERQLHDAFGRVEWERLRAEDGAQYAAARADFRDAFDAIANRRREVESQLTGAEQSTTEELGRQHAERMQREHQKLVERIPEWADPDVMKRESAEVVEYMATRYGATPEEVNYVSQDHRQVDAFRKAMQHDTLADRATAAGYTLEQLVEAAEKAPGVKKKVKASPTLRPGASMPGSERQRSANAREGKMRDQLRKTGSQKDAEALMRARLERRGI